MAIFILKSRVNPFGKMSIFRLFELLVFIAQKGVFSLQNIIKDIFLGYIAQKKKLEKWSFFDQNHGLTPMKKFLIFDFLNFMFLQPRKSFFRARISLKTFSWGIFAKKKDGKMAIFGPKTWVNPFAKMSIFRLFELFVFIAQKSVFAFQNIIKDIFLGYIA